MAKRPTPAIDQSVIELGFIIPRLRRIRFTENEVDAWQAMQQAIGELESARTELRASRRNVKKKGSTHE